MQRLGHVLVIAVAVTALVACKKKPDAAATEGSAATGSGAVAAGSGSGDGSAAGSGAVAAGSGSGDGSAAGSGDGSAATGATRLAADWTFRTPESVYYDAGRDMYMVSNIDGGPADVDDNGFVMVLNPDGSNERAAEAWAWLKGDADDIKLDAPKGMAIAGETIYVADITVVRRFDRKTGAQQPEIAIEGATFLNDVADAGDGGVFVSDSGVDAKFEPTGADAVYHIAANGKVTVRIKDKDLGHPNGVWAGAKRSVWVATFGSGEVFEVDAKGAKRNVTKLPTGKLDGIVVLDDGDLLVSSWDGKCVYRGKPGGEWKVVISDLEAPADIGYDPKRKRVLVPSFTGNTVTAYPLE